MAKVGFGRCEIAVESGAQLIGFEGVERKNLGVHDPLFARSIVIERGTARFAIVCCDLLTADAGLAASLSGEIKKLGIEPEHLYLAATHTHSGTGGYALPDARCALLLSFIYGEPDERSRNAVGKAVIAALSEAVDSLGETSLCVSAVKIDGIGTDRNDPSKPGDGLLTYFLFERNDGKRALLYSAACHPTVLHEDNLLVSADFPGVTTAELESGFVDFAMFLNGSAGDVSTRFTREGVGFNEVERLGKKLAEQVKAAVSSGGSAQTDFYVEASRFDVSLSVRDADPARERQTLDALTKEYEGAAQNGADAKTLRLLKSRCEGAALGLLYSLNKPDASELNVETRFLRLGDYLLCFFPFEIFSALTNPLRERSEGRVVPVGYACDYLGYLPDLASAKTDCYERFTTAFEYGEGERLIEAVDERLRALRFQL